MFFSSFNNLEEILWEGVIEIFSSYSFHFYPFLEIFLLEKKKTSSSPFQNPSWREVSETANIIRAFIFSLDLFLEIKEARSAWNYNIIRSF